MQAITKILPVENIQKKLDENSRNSSQKSSENGLITLLFIKFRRIYGKKWDDQFATGVKVGQVAKEWQTALQDLLPEQFERGLIRCRDECEWPPSIATFRKFATGADEHWEHRGPAYKQTIQALPKPKANVENVREQLAAMRQALNNR